MKFMTFTASCPYTAIANVLEKMKIDIEDYQIIKESQIPYLFAFNETLSGYCCSSQLQGKFYFDLYLNQIGLAIKEVFLDKSEVCNYLINNPLSILGLNTAEMRHSFVFIKYENNIYTFLNPHYENDNKSDYLECIEDELISMLNDKTGISTIIEEIRIIPDMVELITKSINVVKNYQKDLYQFLSQKITPEEILKQRDLLLRPIGLDLLPMMKIIEKEKLINLLTEIKQECMTLIIMNKSEIGFNVISKDKLDSFFFEYIFLLTDKINNIKSSK